MRRILQLSTLGLLAGVASACSPDTVFTTEVTPVAGVRFINAVPDTGAAFGLDFRFVDIVENSDAYRITYRNTPSTSGAVTAAAQIQYKPAKTGARHFRIFLSDSLLSAASVTLKDSTATLEAGHNYTFLLWGQRAIHRRGQDAAHRDRRERTGSRSTSRASRHQRGRDGDRRSTVCRDWDRAGSGRLVERGRI
jgi:hypothetical protein